jgi:hypothetical protein
MLPQLLYRRAINLSSIMSVTADLAMSAVLRELEEDKVEECRLLMPKRSICVGVPRKTEQR